MVSEIAEQSTETPSEARDRLARDIAALVVAGEHLPDELLRRYREARAADQAAAFTVDAWCAVRDNDASELQRLEAEGADDLAVFYALTGGQ